MLKVSFSNEINVHDNCFPLSGLLLISGRVPGEQSVLWPSEPLQTSTGISAAHPTHPHPGPLKNLQTGLQEELGTFPALGKRVSILQIAPSCSHYFKFGPPSIYLFCGQTSWPHISIMWLKLTNQFAWILLHCCKVWPRISLPTLETVLQTVEHGYYSGSCCVLMECMYLGRINRVALAVHCSFS